MINENLLTFADVLSEELEVDTRTPEMINEAQENLRQTIDAHFTSTPKITSKQLKKLFWCDFLPHSEFYGGCFVKSYKIMLKWHHFFLAFYKFFHKDLKGFKKICLTKRV